MTRRAIVGILVALVIVSISPSVAGAVTSVDPVLGGQPILVDPGPGQDVASGIVAQPDGKIVVVGTSNVRPTDGNPSTGVVLRFLADGRPDPTFGDGGKVLITLAERTVTATAVALQPNGAIVVVGSSDLLHPYATMDTRVVVTRLQPTGAPDPTFNAGAVLLVARLPGSDSSSAAAVALQPDGKIVLAGTGDGFHYAVSRVDDVLVLRLAADGTLDPSFGDGGQVLTDTGGSGNYDNAASVAVRPDGRIVVGGNTSSAARGLPPQAQLVMQFSAGGALDPTFANGGIVIDGVQARTSGAVLRPDGTLVTTGTVLDAQANALSVVAYRPGGSRDPRFGGGGRTLSHAPAIVYPGGSIGFNFSANGGAVTVDGRGRLVVAGSTGDLAIARYNSFGAMDTSLGRAGWVTTDVLGEQDEFDAITMLPNGGFAAAGGAFKDNLEQMVFAIYKPTNQPAQPKAWGWNPLGELGDGTTLDHSSPAPVPGLAAAATVAAGTLHSLALDDHGHVYAWGWNGVGQLGDGTTVDRHQPLPVRGLSEVAAIAAGYNHSLAVQDGVVMAWGWNALGQLGDGTMVNRTTPVPVPGLTGVVAVSAGVLHSLALRGDGTVWAWGWNGVGQLGNGSTVDSPRPVQVAGLTDVIAISAGGYHNLALRSDGSVWAWGWNGYGQLGDWRTPGVDRWAPVQITGPGMVAIAAGGLHSLALRADGAVFGWGYNGVGELGDGTVTNRGLPVQVTGLPPAAQIAAGPLDSVATTADHQVWGWGWNAVGTLGDGTTVDRHSPVPTAGPLSATVIAAGAYHTLALGL